jgi:hypothetical protein
VPPELPTLTHDPGASGLDICTGPLADHYQTPEGLDHVDRYRRRLWDQLRGTDRSLAACVAVADALAQITPETVLVCSCGTPDTCHGLTILRAWEWLQAQTWRRDAELAGWWRWHQGDPYFGAKIAVPGLDSARTAR